MPLVPPPAAEEHTRPARAALREMAQQGAGRGGAVCQRPRLVASGGGPRAWRVRHVHRARAAFAPARAHRATKISVKRGHGHTGAQAPAAGAACSCRGMCVCARAPSAPRDASRRGRMPYKWAAIGTEVFDSMSSEVRLVLACIRRIGQRQGEHKVARADRGRAGVPEQHGTTPCALGENSAQGVSPRAAPHLLASRLTTVLRGRAAWPFTRQGGWYRRGDPLGSGTRRT